MKKLSTCFLLVFIIFAQFTFSQEKIDEQIVAKIKTEAFQNSQIMETLGYLTDVFGPRLTSFAKYSVKAQNWTKDKMTSWGLKNSRLEPWGTFGPGWSIEKYSIEMTAPTYDRIIAVPLAWSPSTKGTISGEPMMISIRSKADFDKYRGKLKGAIVMNGSVTSGKSYNEVSAIK